MAGGRSWGGGVVNEGFYCSSLLVIFSVHDIFNTLRYIHISKASCLDNSDFVIVHVSAPWNSVRSRSHLDDERCYDLATRLSNEHEISYAWGDVTGCFF